MKPQYILALARKAYPDVQWTVKLNGQIVDADGFHLPFRLNNSHDLQALEMSLRADGWIFEKKNKYHARRLVPGKNMEISFSENTLAGLLAECVRVG